MAKKEQEKVTAAPAVPLGYCQLGTQVAGHTFEASNAAAVGLLQAAGEGRVFKPLGKPECGIRELNFYESLARAIATEATAKVTAALPAAVNDLSDKGDGLWLEQREREGQTSHSLLAELAAHVPRYYGQLKLVVNQREHTFLQLEDLTHGMSKPCVMDVKIGRRTWDPLSSAQKRAIEEQKYVQCKQNLGLCLPGFQVYQPVQMQQLEKEQQVEKEQQQQQTILIRHGRDYGKSLSVEGFRQALALFFNTSSSSSFRARDKQVLLHEVLRQLRSISAWFKRQRLLHFYASSLLICYDFEELQKVCNRTRNCNGLQNGYHLEQEQHQADAAADQWIRVRCIDFAHIFPATDAQPDHNYMFGLQSLIDIVESMLDR